jgi:hypothetical protein
MPKADPPLAERCSGLRAYVPLLGGVRDHAPPERYAQARAGGGSEGGGKRLLQVTLLRKDYFHN